MQSKTKMLNNLDIVLTVVIFVSVCVLFTLSFGGFSGFGISVHSAYNPSFILIAAILAKFLLRVFQKRTNFYLIFSLFLILLYTSGFILWQLYEDNNPFIIKSFRSFVKPRPPTRVILITCDTLRADHLGCYGYPKAQTSNIDRLAEGGILFKNHYVQVPATGPSHACILTGKYPWQHLVVANGSQFRSEETSIAEVFKDHGYKTVAWIACEILLKRQGYNQGFDNFYDDLEQEPKPQENRADKQTNRAIDYFKTLKPGEKVFAWLHYFDPHSPYRAPQQYKEKFLKNGDREVDTSRGRLAWIFREKVQLKQSEIEDIIAVYDAEVSSMDAEIGRLISFLQDSNMLEDTLIILTADHGEELYDHDCFIEHNQSLYEGVVHAPLIFYSIDFTKLPGVRTEFTESVDIFPTILSLAGIDAQNYNCAGNSLSDSLWTETPIATKDALFAQFEITTHFDPTWSIRKGNWKMILSKNGDIKLFNLALDPEERVNLQDQENAVRQELQKEIMDILNETCELMQPLDVNALPPETYNALKALGYLN